jgi:hypothetical protein
MNPSSEMIGEFKVTQFNSNAEFAQLGDVTISTILRYFGGAKKAGAATEVLESDDPISAVVDFARQNRITQIFIGHSAHNTWRDRLFGDPVLRLIRAAEGTDNSFGPKVYLCSRYVLSPMCPGRTHRCMEPRVGVEPTTCRLLRKTHVVDSTGSFLRLA